MCGLASAAPTTAVSCQPVQGPRSGVHQSVDQRAHLAAFQSSSTLAAHMSVSWSTNLAKTTWKKRRTTKKLRPAVCRKIVHSSLPTMRKSTLTRLALRLRARSRLHSTSRARALSDPRERFRITTSMHRPMVLRSCYPQQCPQLRIYRSRRNSMLELQVPALVSEAADMFISASSLRHQNTRHPRPTNPATSPPQYCRGCVPNSLKVPMYSYRIIHTVSAPLPNRLIISWLAPILHFASHDVHVLVLYSMYISTFGAIGLQKVSG
jgi:hypothetical protein